MANTSIEKQADVTIKVLLSLIAAPRISGSQLAKATGLSQSGIARIVGRLKDAGVRIDYNFSDEKYDVKFSTDYSKSLLGEYARKLGRILKKSAVSQTPVKFVQSLERYSLPEFGQAFGFTPQNVYNMIIGYKGQELPSGYVAYQMQDRGKWLVQRMERDRSGKHWLLPENITKEVVRYVVGTGEEPGKSGKSKRSECKVYGCHDLILARELCRTHYYMERRNPDKFRGLRLVGGNNG